MKYFFGSEEEMNHFVDKVKKVIPPRYVVGATIAGLLVYGAYLLKNPTSSSAITTGDIYNNVIISGTNERIPEELAQAIIDGVTNKRAVAGATINVLKPAKEQPGSSLSISEGSAGDLSISADFISNTPDELSRGPDEISVELSNVTIEIRATDLDSRDKGWEGRIQGLTNRIKIEFDEDIDTAEIDRKKVFKADVVLTSRFRAGEPDPRPHSMYIERAY